MVLLQGCPRVVPLHQYKQNTKTHLLILVFQILRDISNLWCAHKAHRIKLNKFHHRYQIKALKTNIRPRHNMVAFQEEVQYPLVPLLEVFLEVHLLPGTNITWGLQVSIQVKWKTLTNN